MNVLLSTAYLPNLHYFYYVLNANKITIEAFENYQKQSYRNRTRILTANGILNLSIPLIKNASDKTITSIQICYKEKWQANHWRAITSAYKNSPYFDYFEDEFFYFYKHKFDTLLDFNTAQLQLILKILKLKKEIFYSSQFLKLSPNQIDVREFIHPKKEFVLDLNVCNVLKKKYYQTFENKFDFYPNLSVIDCIFNIGLETKEYLILE